MSDAANELRELSRIYAPTRQEAPTDWTRAIGSALIEIAERVEAIEARQKKANSLLGMLIGRSGK